MATKIQWVINADGSLGKTWNPIRGCSRCSPGCAHCYAEQIAARFSGKGQPFHLFAERKPEPHWTGRIELVESKLEEPLHVKAPTTWFVNSMSDLFHEDLPDEAIDRVFAAMALCPQHTFQVLTKRAERMRKYFAQIGALPGIDGISYNVWERIALAWDAMERAGVNIGNHALSVWPLPNVWLGVSVENQQYADERIPHLLQTPAAVRFISAEPLLGPVDLAPWIFCKTCFEGRSRSEGPEGFGCKETKLDWVIVGGESGHGARECGVPWIRSIVQQCKEARVPCFVKQLGTNPTAFGEHLMWWADMRDPKGGDIDEWPDDLRVREYPKHSTPDSPMLDPTQRNSERGTVQTATRGRR